MSYSWIDVLETIIKEYNHTIHSKTQKRPVDITKQNEKQILHTIYKPNLLNTSISKFQVRDKVRISVKKHIFEKGYTPNFSTEVFTVQKVLPTTPITYILEDYQNQTIKGCFYKEELIKTKVPDIFLVEKIIKKRGNKNYVKWYGFDDTHNSWIEDTEIINK